MFEFSQDVLDWVVREGWSPGRHVSVSPSVSPTHPAHAILSSFGSLTLTSTDETFSDHTITEIEFTAIESDDPLIREWRTLLASTLVGIGYGHNQHEEIYTDETGRIFASSLMHDAFYMRGLTLQDCLRNILNNVRAKPMLRPNQPSVTLYGIEFTEDSPEVYRY